MTTPRLLALAALLVAAVNAPRAADAIQVAVSTDTGGPSTRAVLTFSKQVACQVVEAPGKVRVACDQPIAPSPAKGTLTDAILTGFALEGDRTVAFTTGRGYKRIDSFEIKNPSRLVLDFQGERAGGSAAAAAPAAAPGRTGTVIVIDPGHGGVEVGAVGVSGLEEKAVTLDLSRRLAALLQKQGITAVLTRDEDRVMPLDDRTAIANQNRAELFLSIHLNASKRKSAIGAETYYLSADATDAEARTLAALENKAYQAADSQAATPATPPDPGLELVLWDLAQNSYLAESSRLAESIQKELNALTGVRDRGVRQAPFRVLMGATMPAILVEVGFISNPDEEARLKADAYKDKIVDAIARAVADFRRGVAALDTGGGSPAGSRP